MGKPFRQIDTWKTTAHKVHTEGSDSLFFKRKLLRFYLAALGLTFGRWNLQSSLQHAGSFSCSMCDLLPWPGIELRPPHCECRVSATGPLGKSQVWFSYVQMYLYIHVCKCAYMCVYTSGLPRCCSGKESSRQCRRHKRHRFNPGSERYHGVGNSNWLQYSCLENSMHRRA